MIARARQVLAVACVAACLLWGGCASTRPVSLAAPTARPTADAYFAVHKRVTRHGQLTATFDSVMTIDATLATPEFRSAYAERYIKLYNVPESERDRLRAQLIGEGADALEFHLETATHAFEANNLAASKSMWRITLLDDKGREIAPIEVGLAREHRDLQRAFYPDATDFTKGWRIRFPMQPADSSPTVGPGTRSLTLRLGSPHGSIDLTWRLATVEP